MAQHQKRNLKQAVGQVFGNAPAFFITSVTAAASILITSPQIFDDTTAPDEIGTEHAASVLAEHEASFSALQEMKAEIELDEARATLGGASNLTALKDAFANQAVDAYLDLYTDGASAEGAAISETQFQDLRDEFTQTIADPSDLGFQSNIEVGMLDELLAEHDLTSNTDAQKYQKVKALDQAMADSLRDNQNIGADVTFSLLGSLGSIVMLFIFCGPIASGWRNEPKYVTSKAKPKKPGKYGQH